MQKYVKVKEVLVDARGNDVCSKCGSGDVWNVRCTYEKGIKMGEQKCLNVVKEIEEQYYSAKVKEQQHYDQFLKRMRAEEE